VGDVLISGQICEEFICASEHDINCRSFVPYEKSGGR
jgi:uncharacterized protein (DUF342 family)